ncbi:PAS domain-containing sensor histidine kinase [Poseidonibacter lekithochrous]|uniref:PAS domain-containing sensor histidine kinase n=1 Tax=Poseidonibacter TaxID=2321187 RepID=UPI001C092F81|nr:MULTISPECIES: PAS domain-containing sensor histidine kinase [Poseidonibacter]MBU3014908.1 PAS domain-containing sensor histidine kinase [Poseidonibacter lekithochrous]MDO6828206.1 PAS domain-containing sensor histidine kinase [Poseidonibacter sp. 1_MG-2023]
MKQFQLKEQIDNFKKNKFAIIRYWINKENIILILNTRKIDKELFIKRYAFGLLDYYINIISETMIIGKCSSTNDFLSYLNKQDVKPEELFILCSGLKNALLEFLIELNLNNLEITNELNILFEKVFTNSLKIYNKKAKAIEEALNKSADIVDKQVILSRTDINGKIIKVSSAFCKVNGYKSSELVGKSHNILKHNDTAKEIIDDLWKTISAGKIWVGELKNTKKNGDFYWVETTIYPNFDNMGNIISFDAISQNITSKKVIESQQNLLIEQSKHAAMGEMISMIAHQWRQPLQAVSILVQKLPLTKMIDGEITDKLLDSVVDDVGKQLNYMSKTIDDFRDFFKPNRNKELIDISIIINKSLDFLGYLLKANSIKLNIKNDTQIKVFVYVNEIVQAIINIIKNSCDILTEKKIEEKVINISTLKEDGYICIMIEDNAGGIPNNVIGKIFEPYFSTKTNKNGTGLGLYMCKTIIEQHSHGVISVENTNIGAMFTIKLPVE